MRSLHSRANNLYYSKRTFVIEINNILDEFREKRLINKCFNDTQSVNKKIEVRGSIVIPYVRGVFEKIRKIAYTFRLRSAFHSRHTLGTSETFPKCF